MTPHRDSPSRGGAEPSVPGEPSLPPPPVTGNRYRSRSGGARRAPRTPANMEHGHALFSKCGV